MRSLIWFRNDLRVTDNATLNAAVKASTAVIPVYILDPEQWSENRWGHAKTGPFRAQFLLESLSDLKADLEDMGGTLLIRRGAPAEVLKALAEEFDAKTVFATAEHTREEVDRQEQVSEVLDLRLEEQLTMYHPDDLPFELHQLPDVFTRFRGKMEKRSEVRDPLTEPEGLTLPEGLKGDAVPSLDDLGVEAKVADARGVLPFKGGAAAAWERLDHYFWDTKKLRVYKKTRNGLLGGDYSSKFSPWLALGCISPREIHAQVRAFEKEIEKNEDTYWLIFELIWRDYFRYVAMRYGNRIFHKRGIKEEAPKWRTDRRVFEAWCEGRTKCDFVNANMRELAATGFMSNRGRQNVASYLVHDLGVDWRLGASWFEHLLLDHDPASNYGNWIYVAGVGNDPRPSRKFNTTGQAERYDADGKYRRHWSHATLELDL